ncbi:MAG: S8 family serine peptidase [Rhodospirillales bacterium]|nr:S8 family serine peptidase [Rhodospirillales bacterium]
MFSLTSRPIFRSASSPVNFVMPLLRAAPVFLSACLGLAGCSGGGSSSCPVATVEGCITETEYRAQLSDVVHDIRSSPSLEDRWGLATINIVDAWGHLQVVQGIDQPGDGVSVGVVDSGIDLSHPTFQEGAAAGHVTERFRVGAVEETGEESSHGTAVASIIAGRANPEYTFPFTGIAPYASLKMFAIPLGDPPPRDQTIAPVSLATLTRYDEDNTELYREVLAEDLDVLNLSIAFRGLIEHFDNERDLRDALPNLIETLAQSGRRDKMVIVWAAGNSNDRLCRAGTGNCVGDTETDYLGRPAGRLDSSSPDVLAGLMTRIVELRGHSVAAVAIGEDGEIAPFSNRCGIAATWCIAAPGLRVWTAYFGPYRGNIIRGYAPLSGTSIAAPMVSGGLALMDQFFRDQLAGEELVTRLFTTADRTGRYADRSTYGHGLMDLNAALSPVGVPRIAAGTAAVGDGAPVRTASLRLGPAFGDGPANAFAGQEIAGFDALGAPFWYDLGQFVGTRVPLTPSAQLRDFMAAAPTDPYLGGRTSDGDTMVAGPRLGFRGTPGGADVGHARLAQDAITLTVGQPDGIVATAFTTEGDGNPQPVSGALISWNPADVPLSLRVGWLGESRSLLAATAEGAFGDLAARSVFVGVDLDHELAGWRLGGGPELGFVRSRARGSIITDIEPLVTSAFSLHAARPTAGDGTLRLTLAQPLRIEDGDAVLSVPVGRTLDRAVVRRTLSADLAPAGRQLDLSVRWERPFARGEFRIGAVATRHAGHDAEARPWLTFMAGWRAWF